MSLSRREFLGAATTAAAGLTVRPAGTLPWITVGERTPPAAPAARPVVVSAANGMTPDASGKRGIQVAYDRLVAGAGPLDAVVAGVNGA